ncbi:MAG: hypothetical protein LC750_16715 [Actinobacteria bacterium]|nr:hypothetical protein [Actinomycetota bacterium]
MSEKDRSFGLRPQLITRAATVACLPCARCGTRQAVWRRLGLFCVYCSTPATPAPASSSRDRGARSR